MDQGKNGIGGASPEREADQLQEKVEAIRGDLGDLVGELDRRRHRAGRPLVIVAAAATALAALGAGAFLFWRRRHRRRARVRARAFASAFRRTFAHPERVAQKKDESSVARKVALSAAASAASVVARRAAQRLMVPSRAPATGEADRH